MAGGGEDAFNGSTPSHYISTAWTTTPLGRGRLPSKPQLACISILQAVRRLPRRHKHTQGASQTSLRLGSMVLDTAALQTHFLVKEMSECTEPTSDGIRSCWCSDRRLTQFSTQLQTTNTSYSSRNHQVQRNSMPLPFGTALSAQHYTDLKRSLANPTSTQRFHCPPCVYAFQHISPPT